MPAYDAFISYSHAKDMPIARALQSVVQTLGKPWYKLRELRVFRDDTSIAATPHLWGSIETALGQTRYLILLASPESAKSTWVNKEVAYWLEHKSVNTLLIALTGGSLSWDGAANDFAWTDATPLPPVLKGRFPEVPLWVDLTAFRETAQRSDSRLAELAASFAAAVRGVAKEDLLSEELRQKRRALRLAWSAAATMFVLAVGVAWYWHEAATQRDKAERTLATSTKAANALVTDLGQRFRETRGIQQEFVIGVVDQARKLVEELAKGETDNPELMESRGFILVELSSTLRAQGDWDHALQYADGAITMFRTLLKTEPSREDWQEALAGALDRRGDVLAEYRRHDEALAAYDESLAIFTRLMKPDKPSSKRNVAVADEKIGDIKLAQNRSPEALAWYQKSVDLRKQLAADASDIGAQRDLAVAYEKIGSALIADQKPDAALPSYNDSRDIAERLARANPERTDLKRDLAVSYQRLADLQQALGKRGDALELYRKDYAIISGLAASDDRIDWKDDLLSSTQRLADALLKDGRSEEAIDLYRKAIPIAEQVGQDPKYAARKHDLATIHHKLGETLRLSGRLADAVASYQASLVIRIDLARKDPAPQNWEAELRENFQRLGDLEVALKKPQDALAVARQRAQIVRELHLGGDLGLARALGSLAWYALCASAPDAALVAAQEAIAIVPQELWPKGNQAHALMFLGSTDAARRIYLAHRGEMFSKDTPWEDSVLGDFVIFESSGLTNPLIAEIKTAFSVPRRAGQN